MIIKKKESDVLTKGDFQNTEVSVSKKSLDKIVYLLSNGLYRQPLHSTLRETISNSVDAQVEIGIDPIEKPVILSLTPKILSIRDFGVGIDDERMLIIQDLGASTKENRDDLIGAMGIGFFAPLSYTTQFTCDSVIDGIKRSWLIQKVSGKIQIAKISEEPSEEENGTFIAIAIKDTYSEYSDWQEAIKETLCYFKGVYIDCKDLDLNSVKIFEGKHFIINERNPVESFHIVLDQVVYPLSYREFGLPCDIPIGFKFGLNEGITPLPNRESIIIDDLTKQQVLNRVKEGVNELISYAKVYTNALEYYRKPSNAQYFVFGEHFYSNYNTFIQYVKHFDFTEILKKKEVGVNSTYWTLEYLTAIKDCFRLYCDFTYGGNLNYKVNQYSLPTNFILLDTDWNKKIASFVKDKKVPIVRVVRPTSLWKHFYRNLDLKKYPRNEWRSIISSFHNDLDIILKEYPKITDFTDEINKKREKVKQVQVARKSKEIISISTPTADGKSGKYKLVMNSADFTSDKLPVKGLYIYSNDREELDILHHLWQNNSKIYPCFMTEKNIEKIEEIKPKNFIPLSEFTKGSHRLTKKWVTVALIQEELADYRWAYNKKDYYHKQDAPKLEYTWLENGTLNQSFRHILKETAEYRTVYNSFTDKALKGLIETFKTAGLLDYALYREWCYVKTELDKLKLLKEINTGNNTEITMLNHFITYKKGRDFYKQQYLNLKGCK